LHPVPQEAFRSAGIPLTRRHQAGYDHSYYFTASLMADHVARHARPPTPR
jgi:S-formylglutathione hydrolase